MDWNKIHTNFGQIEDLQPIPKRQLILELEDLRKILSSYYIRCPGGRPIIKGQRCSHCGQDLSFRDKMCLQPRKNQRTKLEIVNHEEPDEIHNGF